MDLNRITEFIRFQIHNDFEVRKCEKSKEKNTVRIFAFISIWAIAFEKKPAIKNIVTSSYGITTRWLIVIHWTTQLNSELFQGRTSEFLSARAVRFGQIVILNCFTNSSIIIQPIVRLANYFEQLMEKYSHERDAHLFQ